MNSILCRLIIHPYGTNSAPSSGRMASEHPIDDAACTMLSMFVLFSSYQVISLFAFVVFITPRELTVLTAAFKIISLTQFFSDLVNFPSATIAHSYLHSNSCDLVCTLLRMYPIIPSSR